MLFRSQDFSIRLVTQAQVDDRISVSFRNLLDNYAIAESLEQLTTYGFESEISYQILLCPDVPQTNKIISRLRLLSNLDHRVYSFLYRDSRVLILFCFTTTTLDTVLQEITTDPNLTTFPLGCSDTQHSLRNISVAYEHATYASQARHLPNIQSIHFSQLGIYQFLFPLLRDNRSALEQYANQLLHPLIAYDTTHETELFRTLECYLESNASLIDTAAQLYTHRNTITYRMNKVRELTNCNFDTFQQMENYHVAYAIHHILTR